MLGSGYSSFWKASSWKEVIDACKIGNYNQFMGRSTLGVSQTTHGNKGWERACKENQHGVCKQGVVDLEAMSK